MSKDLRTVTSGLVTSHIQSKTKPTPVAFRFYTGCFPVKVKLAADIGPSVLVPVRLVLVLLHWPEKVPSELLIGLHT